MSIYAFCNDCKEKKYTYDDAGKLIDHTCPSRYDPFDEDVVFDNEKQEMVKISKCPHHERFMKIEKRKAENRAAKYFGG